MLDRDHDQVRARAPPSHVEGRRLAGRGTHRTGPTFNGNRWPTKMGSSMLIGAERDPLSSRSVMKNMRAQLEKLRRRAWEFALIGRKADTDDKRELLFVKHSFHGAGRPR